MQNFKTGPLEFLVPPGFVVTRQKTQKIDSPIPGEKPATERFVALKDSLGKTFYLFCWFGDLPRDLGAMSVAETRPIRLAGIDSEVQRTDVFMGTPQEVLVVYLKVASDINLMAYTPDIDFEKFYQILQNSIRHVAAQEQESYRLF